MRLLDLFCCEGGAGTGYARAGFQVFGVDKNPKHLKRYPFESHHGDALGFLKTRGHEFDAIHASPPCQRYSPLKKAPGVDVEMYPEILDALREGLNGTGKPWVIENVQQAPLLDPVYLDGTMFGLRTLRVRAFETGGGFWMMQPQRMNIPKNMMIDWDFMTVAGNPAWVSDQVRRKRFPGWRPRWASGMTIKQARAVALGGVDWMSQKGQAECIPPAYTEFIGHELMRYCIRKKTGEPVGDRKW